MTDDEAMTVREVADYLKVKDCTIDRLVANGEMPDFKDGGSRRFRKAETDRGTAANAVGPVGGSQRATGER